MKRVSDLIRSSWNEVFELNVYEFFNYCTFDLEYRRAEEEALNRWKREH